MMTQVNNMAQCLESISVPRNVTQLTALQVRAAGVYRIESKENVDPGSTPS
jgi:hypothetical protein